MFAVRSWFKRLNFQQTSRRSTLRRLQVDVLESRQLLTGVPDLPDAEPPPEEIPPPPELTSPAPDAPMGPLPGGTIFDGGWGTGDPGSGGGGSQNTPPVIHEFVCTQGNGDYTFTGYVTDDEDPAGLALQFGGLLAGHSIAVDEYGHFSYTVVIENPPGEVTAIVQDHDELWSNESMVYL